MPRPDANRSPVTLLFHDGELGDVRELLCQLGAPFVERRGALLPEDRQRGFALAIATPQRMLDLELDPAQPKPTQIAVCDSDTRSLRNSLRRAGIQLMIRRPVHPAALRAIVLHSLYRGPERRRSVRVHIGAPVRFRSGWRQRPAVLADLSIGGFRLLATQAIEPGRSIKLIIPPEVTGDRVLCLKGRVLRAQSGSGGAHTLTAKLEHLRSWQLEAIKAVLKAHASGPARLEPKELPELECGAEHESSMTSSRGLPECAAPRRESSSASDAGAGERRVAPRHTIDRRVIALGEEATRVLMGRDISLGGMRVDPNPLLRVGDDVRLAIHISGHDQPLLLTARVHRDDGERGVVLRFHELDRDASQLLDSMLDTLPVVDPGEAVSTPGLIVSEILDHSQQLAPGPSGLYVPDPIDTRSRRQQSGVKRDVLR